MLINYTAVKIFISVFKHLIMLNSTYKIGLHYFSFVIL